MPQVLLQATADEVFHLVLNNMTANTEQGSSYGTFNSREEAIAFYNGEKVEPYGDPGTNHFSGEPTTWGKNFRKGGPLEWCNPLDEATLLGQPNHFGHGIHVTFDNVRQVQVIQRY
jgi:hypothetical protein